MKKASIIVIVLILTVSFQGCSKKSEKNNTTENSKVENVETNEKDYIKEEVVVDDKKDIDKSEKGKWTETWSKDKMFKEFGKMKDKTFDVASKYGIDLLHEEYNSGQCNIYYSHIIDKKINNLTGVQFKLIYADNVSTLNLYTGYKLNLKDYNSENKFDINKTPIAELLNIVTGEKDRDFKLENSEINKMINDFEKNNKQGYAQDRKGVNERISIYEGIIEYTAEVKFDHNEKTNR